MGSLYLITISEYPASLVSARFKLKFDGNVAGKVTTCQKIGIICHANYVWLALRVRLA